MAAPALDVVDLETVDYREATDLQERLRAARRAGAAGDTLLLLEHPPVYTRGRRPDPGGLPLGEAAYRARGIDVVTTKRGGKVTYHGPGQLVGYAIMSTVDVVAFVRTMERALVAALGEVGLTARARADEGADYTGVWIAERKIASIGIHVSHGITAHGFAVNVANDLAPFDDVVACGLPGVRMTSVDAELDEGRDHLPGLRESLARCFAQAHGRTVRNVSADELESTLAGAPA